MFAVEDFVYNQIQNKVFPQDGRRLWCKWRK